MKKVISIMLTVVMLFSMAFTATVFADGETATVTCNSLTGEYLNGYDGKTFSEWTYNVGGYTNPTDFILDGRADYKKSVYMRFKVSDFVNSDIESARVLITYHKNFINNSLNVYAFDESLWNTTTAPIVDRTNRAAQIKVDGVLIEDEYVSSDWAYYAAIDLTDAVKSAVESSAENNKEYFCFVLEPNGTEYGTFYINADGNKPRLQVFTTVPDPEVTLSSDKEAYEAGDDIVITATTANVAQDATVSYTFTVNDEAKPGVDNVLTIADAEEGEYVIKVTCNDGTNTFEDTITVTVTKAGPVMTYNTVSDYTFYNSYDGKTFTEYNNVTNHNQQYNYILNGDKSKLVLFTKFKVSDFENANISSARLLTSMGGGLKGKTIKIYKFDADLWSDTVGPVIDRSDANVVDTVVLPSDAYTAITDNIESTWTYNTQFNVTSAIKEAIANGDEYVCMTIENASAGYSTFGLSNTARPRLQIFTSSNNVPTASLTVSPEKASYLTTDEITVTATGLDADDDATLTYTFYVNDVETLANDNVLTLSNLEAGNNVVKVKVTDQWGDYGVATKTLFVKGTPVKTYNTVEGTFYNSYDEKTFTEYNQSTHGDGYNYLLGTKSGNKFVLYSKFKVSDFASSNVSSARLLTSMGGNHVGQTMVLYNLDTWSDTVGPVVDRSEGNLIVRATMPSSFTKITDDANIDSSWSYNTIFDFTNVVKEAVANGDEYIYFTIERESNGYSTFGLSSSSKPRLQIVTTTNNIPTVSVKADKLTYKEGDSVVLTATGADSDVDSSLTYKFYVDGVEATEGVNGNKLTISNYDGLEHNVTVKCFDEWNDYGVAAIVVKKNMAFEIAAVASGSIETVLSASYQVKNMDTVNPIDATVIIAVYDASGALYDTEFSTSQVGAGQTATLPATLTPKALPEGKTFDGYTAQAMIWTSKTLIPLWECVDFE